MRHDPGLPFEVRGPAGVKVLVRLRVQGTHTGAFGALAATGRKIDIAVLDLFEIRDSVLIEP